MIPITKPNLGEEEVAAVSEALRSGWVSQGPRVAEFESRFAEFTGAAHACAVSNCTTALHLALLAVGVGAGDEVITASHSFIASANSIRYCGATPVFIDIDAATFNMDPSRVEAAITSRTRALLVVHQMGMPADMEALLKIARRHSLRVVEDAACGVGSELLARDGADAGAGGGAAASERWRRVGAPHGDVAVFSFHPRKVLTTGEGGMLTTSSAELDAQFRALRQHCMSVPDTKRHASSEVIFEGYPAVGYNYRMTDMQAAIGLVQLGRLPGLLGRRRELAARYGELLGEHSQVLPPYEPHWARSNWQSYCVRLPAWADQRRVMQSMLDAGVSTRRGIMCAHREGAYPPATWRCERRIDADCGCAQGTCAALLQSESAQESGVILPLYPQMTDSDQVEVVDALHVALDRERGGLVAPNCAPCTMDDAAR